MRVHCDEGVAAHIGPKPCAGIREDVGEASAGERAALSWPNDVVMSGGLQVVLQTTVGNGPSFDPLSKVGRGRWWGTRNRGGKRRHGQAPLEILIIFLIIFSVSILISYFIFIISRRFL